MTKARRHADARLKRYMARVAKAPQVGEIIVPHEKVIQPVSSARNVLIQSSIAKLRDHGYYDRYATHVDPAALAEIMSNVGPSWLSIELADAHYAACDALDLTIDQIDDLGQGAGQRVRETSIVVATPKERSAPFDVWGTIGVLHRSWRRIYQGGSVQITKLDDTEQLLEFRGFTLNRHRYFRYANAAAVKGAHESVGVRVKSARIVRYDPATHETVVHLVWR